MTRPCHLRGASVCFRAVAAAAGGRNGREGEPALAGNTGTCMRFLSLIVIFDFHSWEVRVRLAAGGMCRSELLVGFVVGCECRFVGCFFRVVSWKYGRDPRCCSCLSLQRVCLKTTAAKSRTNVFTANFLDQRAACVLGPSKSCSLSLC